MSQLKISPQLPGNQKGYVWLVGAGPGAADLLTLRGKAVLEQAEVVIYDSLAGKDLLQHCSPQAKLIFVGKRAGQHHATQTQINELLVRHALAGRRVVRLKGGDPGVFGRVAEELAVLHAASIPWEIVPGVTAACAAAAAAGISLTQRGVASAAIFATGHECDDKDTPALDWEHLARPGHTLCLYMSTRTLEPLARRLLAAGRTPDTPVLIVSHASLPAQTIRHGTLAEAATLAAAVQGSPSLIIIGDVGHTGVS